MTPDPDLARRLAAVAPNLKRLRRVSDRKLVAAGREFVPTQRALAKRIGFSAISLSRAMAAKKSTRRPLSAATRERLIEFIALEGDVPIPPRVPAGWRYDPTEDRASVRLLKREANRFRWLARRHPGHRAGVIEEALANYLRLAGAADRLAPPPLPIGVVRVPLDLPVATVAKIEALDAEPQALVRHLRAALVAWMERQPAGPPDLRATRTLALLRKLKPGVAIGVAEAAKLTGASKPVARQVIYRLMKKGVLVEAAHRQWQLAEAAEKRPAEKARAA